MTAIRPAATVVLLRDRKEGMEVLLLRRNADVAFAGGMWVFPGGGIDTADYAGDLTDVMAAARRAAVRETREEAGLTISEDDLLYFNHWTTPEGYNKRYATWFFLAAADSAEEVQVDGSEIDLHRWTRPGEAVAAHRSHSVDMLPPTLITLETLAQCNDIGRVVDYYRSRPVREILPKPTKTAAGQWCMLYQGDAGYERGDPEVSGTRNRCWLREDGWHYESNVIY